MALSISSKVILSECYKILVDHPPPRLKGSGNIGTLGKPHRVNAQLKVDQIFS